MKKTLALVLAGVMAAGMTTVAFAADEKPEIMIATSGTTYIWVDGDDDGKFEDEDKEKNQANEREVEVTAGESVSFGRVDGGKKVALPLFDTNGNSVTDKDAVKGYKVKADWSVGELDEKPIIEYVKINDEYRYAVTFTLPEGQETKTADLAGKISVYNKSSQLKDDYEYSDYVTLKIGSEYGYEEKELEAWDDLADAKVVIFKDKASDTNLEGEETLTFGDLLEFEVDVTGQGKLNLKNSTDFNKEFAAMYDYANIDFITFEKSPSFNKIGRVYIYAPEDAFIYEVTADGAKEINGLEWDEDYEAWTFRTRTLGSYAISDVELDEKTVTEDKDDTTTDGGKTNPDTGR